MGLAQKSIQNILAIVGNNKFKAEFIKREEA